MLKNKQTNRRAKTVMLEEETYARVIAGMKGQGYF